MGAPSPENVFELWAKYEDIAMHFNELLIQYRLQLLGGFGALTTVGGYILSEKVKDRRHKYRLLSLYTAIFGVLWAAAATLDLFYYRELLEGAVRAIRELEGTTAKAPLRIHFSTLIEEQMGSWKHAPWICYGIVEILVVAAFVHSRREYRAIVNAGAANKEARSGATPDAVVDAP